MEEITKAVCKYYQISQKLLLSKSRKAIVVRARFTCFYLIRRNLHWSLQKIAKEFKKDHASVLHGINKVEYEMEMYEDVREDIKQIWIILKYNIDVEEDFTQSIYREIIADVLKYDSNIFSKLGIEKKTRKWIYKDLEVKKEIINEIELKYGKAAYRKTRPDQ